MQNKTPSVRFEEEFFGKDVFLHIEVKSTAEKATEQIIEYIKQHPFRYMTYFIKNDSSVILDEEVINTAFERTCLLDEN